MSTTRSIRFRLNSLFFFVITGLLLAFGTYNYFAVKAEREAALLEQADSALVRLTTSLPSPLWNFDKTAVEQILKSEMGAGFIEAILVVNGGKVSAGMGRASDGKPIPIDSAPVAATDSRAADLSITEGSTKNPLGKATIYISHAGVEAALRSDLWRQIVQIVALDVILLLALSIGLAAIVLRPLTGVRMALAEIGSGRADLTKRLPDGQSTEFKDIAHHFNQFVARLEEVVLQVRRQAQSVAIGSQEIAKGNMDLSHRTEEQASSLQETSAALRGLTLGVSENAESSARANQLAHDASAVAQKSGHMMDSVVSTMRDISDSAKRITDIIAVIDGIAFQTNILALNAAVEAARAGEQGRGFAVVAAEVRSLAQRSAEAAKEIKTLIQGSSHKVEMGQSQVNDAGQAVASTVDAIRRVSVIVGEITAASQQQRTGIDQINNAVATMEHATQQNAALVEEISAAASSVRDSSAGVVESMLAFSVDEAQNSVANGHSLEPKLSAGNLRLR